MRVIIVAGLVALLAAPLASAQDRTRDLDRDMDMEQDVGYRGWGPRAGLSIDPDQFVFGAHIDFGHIARRVRLQPNAEIGIGDDATIVAINLDAAYRFSTRWESWRPYLGLGPSFQIVSVDIADDIPGVEVEDDTETEFGMMMLGGIERGVRGGNRFFTELKLTLFDTPDVKIIAGYTFF
ncbi:MAG: hypothetical protein R6X25_04225 [Candidatus Krumholzibacteriia bacterium]